MTLPDQAAAACAEASRHLLTHGDLLWQRTHDWQKAVLPSRGERGGGTGEAPSDTALEDRLGDRKAAGYHAELTALLGRMVHDSQRLATMVGIVCPDPPQTLQNRDLLAAQVAADGWCISCWRDHQHLEPIAVRPNGQARYRDRCRWCGEWRASQREDPPLDMLRAHHEGRRIRVRA